jgi:hypothetical protein
MLLSLYRLKIPFEVMVFQSLIILISVLFLYLRRNTNEITAVELSLTSSLYSLICLIQYED